jgi:putative redox protein
MISVEMERVEGDFGFEARDHNGHLLLMDSSVEHGGNSSGLRPMQVLLMALGGCSAIDIVTILKKQRQVIESFKIKIQGEREEGTTPSLWKKVQINFELSGRIDADKAKKACTLSVEKYCSVAETLRRAGAEIRWDLNVYQTIKQNEI